MALTYEESAVLMQDPEFRGRIKVACLKFADSIIIEQPNVPAHSSRVRWAQQTYANPEAQAMQAQPPTVIDPKVQDAGVDANGHSLISDLDLQSALETTVGKMM